MKDPNYLEQAREYLSKGSIQKSLDLLQGHVQDEDIRNQLYQLEVRLNSLKKKINSGIINLQDSQLEENRISNALLFIISNLAKENVVYSAVPITKKSFNFKWLVIGMLGLLVIGAGTYYFSNRTKTTTKVKATPIEKREVEEVLVDLCDRIRCLNGGKCVDGKCSCPDGYQGDRCQTKIETSVFRVSGAVLAARPDNVSGKCPQQITFIGKISTIGGRGTVSYRFVRSDGGKGAVQTLRFDQPGAQRVSTSWRLGSEGESYENYWEAIQILEPNQLESNQANFTLNCEKIPTGFRVMEATLRANPRIHTGNCPKKITFSGRISAVGGRGTVSYRFIRKDGAKGPVQSLTFASPGSKTVSTTWQLGGPGRTYEQYWEAIKILEPNEMESNKAYFNLKCQ